MVAGLCFAIASRPFHASTAPQPIVTTLVGYNLVFDEEFKEGSNFNAELSEWGPISPPVRWIMHTPYAGGISVTHGLAQAGCLPQPIAMA